MRLAAAAAPKTLTNTNTMKPETYQIIARLLFFSEYRRLRRQVREDIAHAIQFPGGGIAARVEKASRHLRVQFGK